MKENADLVRVSAEKESLYRLVRDLLVRAVKTVRRVLVLRANVRNATKEFIRPINSKYTVTYTKIPRSLFV